MQPLLITSHIKIDIIQGRRMLLQAHDGSSLRKVHAMDLDPFRAYYEDFMNGF